MRICTLTFFLTILFSPPCSFAAPAELSAAQILSGIYQPWTGPLHELENTLLPERNYIVWVHVPAQHPMDMRSSEGFRRWALATPVTELTISHNMVAFRCRDSEGQWRTGATGMTGSSNLQDAKALIAGYGLSVFFSTFTDGHLNPQKEVGEYIEKNLAKRGAVFAGFEVSGEQCDAMQAFLHDFVNHPRRPFTRFSNVQDPEKMEGGGCVTFASALMKKAGLLEEVVPDFYRNMAAARYLLGGNLPPVKDVEPPQLPWLKGKRRSISFNLLWGNIWDAPPESFPGMINLHVMDPEKMGYTLKQFAQVYLEGLKGREREKAVQRLAVSPLGQRIVVSANDLADPGHGLQYERFLVNDSFDPEMAAMGRTARAWMHSRLQAGQKLRYAEAVGMPVLLLEKE